MLASFVNCLLRPLGYKLSWLNSLYVRGEDIQLDLRLVTATDSPIVLDVGANEGQTVDRMRDIFRTPNIHCFEPNPKAFEILSNRFTRDSNVILNCEAIGSTVGEIEFYDCPDNTTLSSVLSLSENANNLFAKYNLTKITVTSQTIDDYLSKLGPPLADALVLKLDIQGFELEALKGARQAIENQSFRAIQTEVAFSPIYNKQSNAGELINYLGAFGYIPAGFYNASRANLPNRKPHGIDWCDALFVPIGSLAKSGQQD